MTDFKCAECGDPVRPEDECLLGEVVFHRDGCVELFLAREDELIKRERTTAFPEAMTFNQKVERNP